MATQDETNAILPTRTRRQKRSQTATLVLMGATPFVVLGLDPLHSEVRVFRDLQACQTALPGAQDYCETLNAEAANRHPSLAPKYTSRHQCESDFAHVTVNNSCESGWCGIDDLSVCERTADGYYRPPFSGFLVDQAILDGTYEGTKPAPESLDDRQLQPVYSISDETLSSSGDEGQGSTYRSHTPFLWHYVMANGQYLGNQNLRDPVTRTKSQLAASTSRTFTGTSQRGGFGSTARQTMQAARS